MAELCNTICSKLEKSCKKKHYLINLNDSDLLFVINIRPKKTNLHFSNAPNDDNLPAHINCSF